MLIIGSIPALPVLLFWLWRRARRAEEPCERRRAWLLFGAALATYLWIAVVPVVPRPNVVQSRFFRYWVEYFSARVAYRAGEPLRKGQYLFLMMPHGLYPFSGACATISGMVETFQGMRMAAADVAFRIPVIRHLMHWIGSVPANKAAMADAIRQGSSVCVFPGGISEMVSTDGASERLVLRSRKGVIQLALEHGLPVVPVYVFGQTTLWNQIPLPSWVRTLSRWLQVSIILPYGRFGTFIPRKIPLLFCVGEPIVPPMLSGDVARWQVDSLHQKVVESVSELYDFYKGLYGWEKRPLYIE